MLSIGNPAPPFWSRVSFQNLRLGHRLLTPIPDSPRSIRPYVSTVMLEANKTGVPALRPLFLEFPGDAEGIAAQGAKVDGTLMLGPVQSPPPSLLCTRIATCYPYRAETDPDFVPGIPHVMLIELKRPLLRTRMTTRYAG